MSFSDGRVPMKGIDRKKWTLEEDKLLTQTMMQYQNRNDVRWTDVSPHIPGRSAKACRKRWVNGLNDCLKKGSWTKEEDASLREGVELFNCDWSRIAQHVSRRSGDQCSKRWREVLNPAINKSKWHSQEDELLCELYHKYGSAWQTISTHFDHRPALHCRNRCCKLLEISSYARSRVAKSNKAKQENRNQPETNWDASVMTLFSSSTEDATTHARNDTHERLSNGHHFPSNNLDNSTPHTPNVNTTMTMPPFYQLHEMPEFQTGHEQKENERATGFLKSLQNVQGFSSVSHKDPPAALNLSQLQSLCISHDNMFVPFLESPPLTSSLSATPTTPCLTDSMMLANFTGSETGSMPSIMNTMVSQQSPCNTMDMYTLPDLFNVGPNEGFKAWDSSAQPMTTIGVNNMGLHTGYQTPADSAPCFQSNVYQNFIDPAAFTTNLASSTGDYF